MRFIPSTADDDIFYKSLIENLKSKNRFGVINQKDAIIKNFYIFHLSLFQPVPVILLPFNGQGKFNYINQIINLSKVKFQCENIMLISGSYS